MFIFLKIKKRLCDLAVAHDMPQNEANLAILISEALEWL